MSKKRLLVTGGSGFLGSHILNAFKGKYDITAIYNSHKPQEIEGVSYLKIDLIEKRAIEELLPLSFDYIIHTAALTNVDTCESQPDLAKKLNVEMTQNIIELAKNSEAFLVNISTDQLFDGSEKFLDESAKVNPINNYGLTKAEAEDAISKSSLKWANLRTNFYGTSRLGNSFLDWVIKSANTDAKIFLYENVFYTPISVEDLIRVINIVLKGRIEGTINVVGNERLSKLDFAKQVFSIIKPDYKNYTPSLYEKSEGKALRPLEMSLCNEKLLKLIDFEIETVKEFVKKL